MNRRLASPDHSLNAPVRADSEGEWQDWLVDDTPDQETTLGTEAVFLDGGNNAVVAQVVRKGTGKPLSNESQVMKPDDVKGVIDGWAADLHQSYLQLKAK